jgi:nitroreductase
MHRAFLPDPVPVEQIERIAGVIRRAPSGGFSQGGSIVVVTDGAKRREIAAAFGDEHYSKNGRNFIVDAPVHMVISANEALYHARYNEADKLDATGGVEVTWPVPYCSSTPAR